jgi:hypothetical protein
MSKIISVKRVPKRREKWEGSKIWLILLKEGILPGK